ncbi:hypothetical protein TNCV_2258501 [Trichonephila clavipes]|nr:hypothetical protein TNCV_2258501 [Trichonephila clavipes]
MIFLQNHKNCSKERLPSKMQASKLPAEGLSNISKYPAHDLDIDCYDGNPRKQGLVSVDGACLNNTLHMALEE